MPISDIRRSAMIAGQKLIKFFALAAAVAPGKKFAQSGAQRFYDARGRRSRRLRRNAESLQGCGGEIALNMTRAPTGFLVCNVVALSRLNHPITDFGAALFRLRTVLA